MRIPQLRTLPRWSNDRPRSAESYLGGGADAALSEDLEAEDPFGFGRATVPRGRRARGKAYRPSFLRCAAWGTMG